MSLIVPPPFAIPTPVMLISHRFRKLSSTVAKSIWDVLPKKPLIVLTAIKHATLGLNAVGICSKAKIEKHTRYSDRLPKVSDRGARTSGPIPRKTTKPVVAPTTISSVVFRSVAISAIPGVNMEDASGERTGGDQWRLLYNF